MATHSPLHMEFHCIQNLGQTGHKLHWNKIYLNHKGFDIETTGERKLLRNNHDNRKIF